jgi:hypothetical protein
MSHSLVDRHQCFGEIRFLHLQGKKRDGRGNTLYGYWLWQRVCERANKSKGKQWERLAKLTNVGRRNLEQWRLSDAIVEAPDSKAALRK